jgi:uncharacterized protein YycO
MYFFYFLSLISFYYNYPVANYNNRSFSTYIHLQQEPPLTPSKGGRSIDGRSLRPGDVIFSSTNSTSSKLIRRFTGGGAASHVAVVSNVDANIVFIIEAITSGVRKVPLETFLSENSNAVAFRKMDLDGEQRKRITDYLNQRVGAPYDFFGAFSSAYFKLVTKQVEVDYGQYKTKKTYCSKLFIEAFRTANVDICRMVGNWSTPNDLVTLTLTDDLVYLGHLKYTP